MNCSLPGSSVHGILQARHWKGLPCPPPGIFPTQGSYPGLPHCRQILYQLSHKGCPRILEWVAYSFSSRSSQPRNWTGVSFIADGFFTECLGKLSFIHYELITAVRPVAMHHVTTQSCYNIINYIFCVCTASPWLIYFIVRSLYLLILFTLSVPLTPLPFGNSQQFALCICEFVSVLFLHLFCFLDSTCKWNHVEFFSDSFHLA